MTEGTRAQGIGRLRPAAELYGDVATAYVDVSRTEAQGAQQVGLRVRALGEELVDAGADPGLVDLLGKRAEEPTGHGGDASRIMVARDGELALDLLVAGALDTHAHHGPIAHLVGCARLLADGVRYALVLADHTGASITISDTVGVTEEQRESDGDHDVLHKIPGGGWAQRRFQSRVEDSWDRNAQHVADDLDRLVAREQPDVVVLGGDPYACARIGESVGVVTRDRLVTIEHGSRAEGASEERMEEDVAAALQSFRTRRLDAALDRLGVAEGRRATGVGETLEALRRGQVETLFLLDGALDGREAAVGPQPLHLGHTADEVRALGVADPATAPLEEALLRATLGQDADLVALHAPIGALPDGVGAVLRFDTSPG